MLPEGRQSLVTPIDWKRSQKLCSGGSGVNRRQSLVTPIDWKLVARNERSVDLDVESPILGDAY